MHRCRMMDGASASCCCIMGDTSNIQQYSRAHTVQFYSRITTTYKYRSAESREERMSTHNTSVHKIHTIMNETMENTVTFQR